MIDARSSTETGSTAPICILGMPRSGTTWVGKIFDSHPDTLYRHEPDSGPVLRDVPITVDPDDSGSSRERMRAFLDSIPDRRSLRICGKLPLFRKNHLSGWRGASHRASVYLAKAASPIASLPILEPVDSRRAQPRPVWKSIESTGRAGLIAASSPDSRIVLIVRHPCGQIESTLRGEAGGSFTADCASANDWGVFEQLVSTPQARRRELTMDNLRRMQPDERLAWRWLLFNEKAMEELDGLPNACVVPYESLCERPDDAVREVFAFAGIGWHDAVGTFLATSASGGDSGYYSVYRDPERAATGWRQRLNANIARRILSITSDSLPGRLFSE